MTVDGVEFKVRRWQRQNGNWSWELLHPPVPEETLYWTTFRNCGTTITKRGAMREAKREAKYLVRKMKEWNYNQKARTDAEVIDLED